ncbi:hypothetical protein KUCAC02_035865, partial [Chaenocephalus aceratus]
FPFTHRTSSSCTVTTGSSPEPTDTEMLVSIPPRVTLRIFACGLFPSSLPPRFRASSVTSVLHRSLREKETWTVSPLSGRAERLSDVLDIKKRGCTSESSTGRKPRKRKLITESCEPTGRRVLQQREGRGESGGGEVKQKERDDLNLISNQRGSEPSCPRILQPCSQHALPSLCSEKAFVDVPVLTCGSQIIVLHLKKATERSVSRLQ